MFKRIFAFGVFIACAASALFSVYAQVQEGEVVETVLDNGLKALTVEIHNAP